MVKIKSVIGRQVFDSRGNPTVEAQIYLNNDITASAISPSGASTGAFEAHELRDNEEKKFLGKEFMGLIRSTFLLKKNNIIKEWRNVRVKGHVEEIYNFIKNNKL